LVGFFVGNGGGGGRCFGYQLDGAKRGVGD